MKQPKGVRLGGRAKGTPNKTTASVKAALTEAFEKMGGVKALIAWGRKEENRAEFYKLWGKMLPAEVDLKGEVSGAVKVEIVWENSWIVGDVEKTGS